MQRRGRIYRALSLCRPHEARLGGPGRTRSSDQVIMSHRLDWASFWRLDTYDDAARFLLRKNSKISWRLGVRKCIHCLTPCIIGPFRDIYEREGIVVDAITLFVDDPDDAMDASPIQREDAAA